MVFGDSTPEMEAWMQRNRARRAKSAIVTKIENATRRGFRSIMVPLETARAMLASLP